MRAFPIASLTLATALAAQSAVVSPLTLSTAEGNTSSSNPFGSVAPLRYQQVHSDLNPPARSIRGLSFRQNAGTANSTGTRTYDLELSLCASVRSDAMSFIFNANLLGAPTIVIPRKNVVFGPQGPAANPGPSSFTGMAFVFDTPFAYSGNGSVAWDLKVFGGSATGSFAAADAHDFGRATLTTVSTGSGCIPTGEANPLKIDATGFVCGTRLYYGHVIANGLPGASSVLALGVTNPALTIPGLCVPSYTELLITTPYGTLDATGSFDPFGSHVIRAQNALAGGKVHSQVFILDLNRIDPFKLAGSNGIETTIPATSAIPPIGRIYTVNGSPTDVLAPLRQDTIGYGIVTRFDV